MHTTESVRAEFTREVTLREYDMARHYNAMANDGTQYTRLDSTAMIQEIVTLRNKVARLDKLEATLSKNSIDIPNLRLAVAEATPLSVEDIALEALCDLLSA